MKIPVVDDYSTMRRIVRILLAQINDLDVEEAGARVAAPGKMRENRFGLVISDWNTEPISGLQLRREVRADGRLSGRPFIMVTAESRTGNVIAARAAGVSNDIVKPFNANTLKQKTAGVPEG